MSKKVRDWIVDGMIVEYSRGFFAIAQYIENGRDERGAINPRYEITFHKGRVPYFNIERYATIEELVVAMREIADLRKWRKWQD
jgi:hypothetical protein